MTLTLIHLLFLKCTDTLVKIITKGLWPPTTNFNLEALFQTLLIIMAIVTKSVTFNLSRG